MDVLPVPSLKFRLEHEHMYFIRTFFFVVGNLPFSKESFPQAKNNQEADIHVQAAQDPSTQP